MALLLNWLDIQFICQSSPKSIYEFLNCGTIVEKYNLAPYPVFPYFILSDADENGRLNSIFDETAEM